MQQRTLHALRDARVEVKKQLKEQTEHFADTLEKEIKSAEDLSRQIVTKRAKMVASDMQARKEEYQRQLVEGLFADKENDDMNLSIASIVQERLSSLMSTQEDVKEQLDTLKEQLVLKDLREHEQ